MSPRAPADRAPAGAGRPAASSRTPARRPPASGAAPTSAFAPRTGRPERRQAVLMAVVLALLVVFAGRLVYVQGFASEALASEALGSRLVTRELPADRGRILDAEGVVLADSVERFDIVANQRQVAESREGPLGVAAQLAPVLDLPVAELGGDLTGDRGYVRLVRQATPELAQQVRDLRLPGISTVRTTERVYPSGSTAGNVVGFVGADGHGLAGLELQLEDLLAGTPGEQTYERGRQGHRIPGGALSTTPAVPGRDVHLTIERDLQWRAQEALDAQVRATGASHGSVVALDVRTGRVLVLADSGAVDPNEPGETEAKARGSRAVSHVFEPGSTAKVVTMAAVLEEGLATPLTRFRVPDRYETANGQQFRDSHDHPVQKLTLNGILTTSSNTGTVMVGEKLPRKVRHDYLARFGFGTRTGIELPGESAGILHPAEKWDGRTQYAVLFGQGVSVTALQATQVFATIGNGGTAVRPHLVDAYGTPDGGLAPVDVPEGERVISEETAQTLLQMLESVVADGTGANAAIPGYRVAGKTGTAQAADDNGGMTRVVSSFVGVAPADEPRIAVGVFLFDPKTSIWGSDVAAPVFSEVGGFALQYLGVPPSDTEPDLLPVEYE